MSVSYFTRIYQNKLGWMNVIFRLLIGCILFSLTLSMMIFSGTLLKYEILTNICRIYSMHFELFLSCAFLHYFHIITNSFLYFHIFKYSIILQLSICIEIKLIKQFIRCSLFIKDKSVSSMNAI